MSADDATSTQDNNGTTKLTDEEKIVGRTLKSSVTLTEDELASVNSRPGLVQLLSNKNVDIRKALVKLRYEQELQRLQVELVQLQRDVQINGRRVAILFEGRDAAGKGGTIRRFMEHLNPRTAKIAALAAPCAAPPTTLPRRPQPSARRGSEGKWSSPAPQRGDRHEVGATSVCVLPADRHGHRRSATVSSLIAASASAAGLAAANRGDGCRASSPGAEDDVAWLTTGHGMQVAVQIGPNNGDPESASSADLVVERPGPQPANRHRA